jgi:hypothetical protein
MGKNRYRVLAEDSVVAGHKAGEEFSFDEEADYNVEALIAAGIIEPVKASSSDKEKEE